jgi:phosphohistidine phosphatase
MKTLYILRHAKSSWDNTQLSDFDRPLNKRGLEAAPLIGEIIYKNSFNPELFLSSPAKRAKQTAVLVREVGAIKPEIRFDERIYEASPQTLVQIVSELGEQADSVLLVGHNPGLESLIRFLTGEIHAMPTGALAVVNLNVETWAEINDNCGELKNLLRPNGEK